MENTNIFSLFFVCRYLTLVFNRMVFLLCNLLFMFEKHRFILTRKINLN